jgi:hypothetical protein
MKKFLASQGVKLITIIDDDEIDNNYAFTDDTLRKNSLIKFFVAELGDGEDIETETVISIISMQENACFDFTFFYENNIVEIPPVVVGRVIIDLIAYIGFCDAGSLMEDLAALSTGNTKYESVGVYSVQYKRLKAEFLDVLNRIQDSKKFVN